MNNDQIARVAHEVNRAYQHANNDYSEQPWELLIGQGQQDLTDAVLHAKHSMDRSPEEQHGIWMSHRRAQGWIYGKEKSKDRMTHPNLLPYCDLPIAEKVKDHLFLAVVRSLT